MGVFCSSAQVAQSVEQRTENPRVDGSIPPLGTMNSKGSDFIGAFFMSCDGDILVWHFTQKASLSFEKTKTMMASISFVFLEHNYACPCCWKY